MRSFRKGRMLLKNGDLMTGKAAYVHPFDEIDAILSIYKAIDKAYIEHLYGDTPGREEEEDDFHDFVYSPPWTIECAYVPETAALE